MIIYFRACEKQGTISYVGRHGGVDKTTILKKCWKQLVSQLTPQDKLVVIEDALSQETLNWLYDNSNGLSLDVVSVPEHTWEYHEHTVTMVKHLLEYCLIYPEEVHYIVEDDYLHVDNAINTCKTLYAANPDYNGFIVTYDYPDRYVDIQPSEIFLGPDRHWRTITSATMTLMAKGAVWTAIGQHIKAVAPTSNDTIFEQIFKQVPCLAPLPGLSCHLTDRHYTPYYDWNKMFDEVQL